MAQTILDEIMRHKAEEVQRVQQKVGLEQLKASRWYSRKCHSFKSALQSTPFGIVAEFKRRSPSKGLINGSAAPATTATGYQAAGVAAMSVLTDSKYFGGSAQDLQAVRQAVSLPLLRKDFMLSEYQLHEAKAWGADVVLLIAAALPSAQLKELAALAKELGLEVLLEVHNLQELESSICPQVDVVGVNNRNLKTFEVSVETSVALAGHIPSGFLKISESGISSPETIMSLQQHGYQGFLMGENFMKTQQPGEACAAFMAALEKGR